MTQTETKKYRKNRAIVLDKEKKCAKCGSTENLTVDHIIPLIRGGDNSLNNLQVLCYKCNSRKGRKIEWKWWQRIVIALHADEHIQKLRDEFDGWKSAMHSMIGTHVKGAMAGVENQVIDRIKTLFNPDIQYLKGKITGLESALEVKQKSINEAYERIKAMEDHLGVSFHKELVQEVEMKPVVVEKVKVEYRKQPRKKKEVAPTQ